MLLKEIILVGILLGPALGDRQSADNLSASTNPLLLTDPVFGLTFDPAKVSYERIPMLVRHTCRDFAHGTYWTFARIHADTIDYFIVMGTASNQDGDSFGAAIEISGSKCEVEDSKWMLSGFLPRGAYRNSRNPGRLPGLRSPRVCDQGPLGDCHYVLQSGEEEDILRRLVQNALTRGVAAWGGIAQFKKEICSSSLQQADASMPVVQDEVTIFCNRGVQ